MFTGLGGIGGPLCTNVMSCYAGPHAHMQLSAIHINDNELDDLPVVALQLSFSCPQLGLGSVAKAGPRFGNVARNH